MIERKFVAANIKEHRVKEYVAKSLSRVGLSDVKLQRTPLGEKIIISASRPGLVVGRAGANITKLTEDLKKKFKLENPQIEIEEITEAGLDASIIAESIANTLERFGSARFKGVGHKSMTQVMNAGALGVEILISGKVPSTRAKTWRFYQGYLKKCGDIAITGINKAEAVAKLKTGIVGVKVRIMPPTTKLPDSIELKEEKETIVEEVKEPAKEEKKKEEKKTIPKKPVRKAAPKHTTKKRTTKKKTTRKKK
jgi:small subunit ribosomal protein S3